MKTILITGITGYLGSRTAKYLNSKGFKLIGLTPSQKDTMAQNGNIKLYYLDQTPIEDVFSSNKIDGVIHFAGHIKDKKLRKAVMQLPIHREIHKGWFNFYNAIYNWYWKQNNRLPVYETAKQLTFFRKWLLYLYMVCPVKFYSTDKGINIQIFGVIKTKILPKLKK